VAWWMMQRGDRDQNNALQELKTGKEEISLLWW
jgi:hypothetical protein